MPSTEEALQTAELGNLILKFAKSAAVPRRMNPGQIGAALAAATVYYARECGLDDLSIVRVMQASMSTIDDRRIGPVGND